MIETEQRIDEHLRKKGLDGQLGTGLSFAHWLDANRPEDCK
jgi:hypothetical protein